ncbi:MAG: universal stress protein [Polyangia bacterium]
MNAIKKVLWATDLDDEEVSALDEAVEMTRLNSAELVLLHVVEPLPVATGAGAGMAPNVAPPAADPTSTEKQRTEQKRASLAAVANDQVSDDIVKKTRVERGSAPEKIVEVANEENADLLVLATHGRRGIKRLVLGSVAEQVVRRAPCPVLTVNPSAE